MNKLLILLISICFTVSFNTQANTDKWDDSKKAMGEAWEKTKEATDKALDAAKSKADELLEDGTKTSDKWIDSLKENTNSGWNKAKKKAEELKIELENKIKEQSPPPKTKPAPVEDATPEWQKA